MDSFQRKLQEVKRVIEEDSYRRRVLTLCQQSEPKSFDEYSSSGSFRKLEKFESSTYSEVLKAIDLADNNRPVVMKIMRALSKGVLKLVPSLSSKGCQSYNDILNELVVTQALSQLHEGVLLNGQPSALYKTHFFCLIHEIKVVSGNMEKTLSKSKQTEGQKNVEIAAADAPQARQTDAAGGAKAASDNMRSDAGQKADQSNGVSQGNTSDAATLLESRQAPSFASAKRQFERDQRQNDTESSEQMGGNEAAATNETTNGQVSERENVDNNEKKGANNQEESNKKSKTIQSDEELVEDERMLKAALPHEYVVSVMRHDGQPLWWMMTHKKLSPEQLTSVLVQVIVGLAIAEHVYLYEHRDLHVSNILIKRTKNEMIPFVVDGRQYQIVSHGIKATIIDATFSRLTHNGKVYFRDLTSTLRAYGARKTPPRMSLQNRSYRQMVRLTKNKWDEFAPKTNLIWLTYLCETLMKNETMKTNANLTNEIKKVRDHTLKVRTTLDLLSCFPFEKVKTSPAEGRRDPK